MASQKIPYAINKNNYSNKYKNKISREIFFAERGKCNEHSLLLIDFFLLSGAFAN